jgi:hypothetical protein
MKLDNWSETLPGGELVRQGVADFQAGRCTVPACLVGIGRTRLSRAGLLPASLANPFPDPERQLYRLLCDAGGDAYSRYNALVRELVSFEHALDRFLLRAPTSAR